MKKTTGNPPGTNRPGSCPSSGMLSAFIEGQLSQENRNAIFSHLRQCETCYQVIADSVKLMRDLPESIRESDVIYTPSAPLANPPKRKVPVLMKRFGKFQNVALVSPIAAIFLFTVLFKSGPEWGSDEVFNALKDVNDFAEISRSIPVEEYKPITLGFNRGLSDQKLAFKTGSFLGRLEISRIAGDTEKSQFYSDKLSSLLNRSDFTKKYNHEIKQDLQTQVDQIEEFFLSSDADFYFKLGLFVESGLAYSLVGKSELFDKNYLKALINHPQFNSLPLGVSRRFKEIESLLFENSIAQNNEIIYKLLQDIQQILS